MAVSEIILQRPLVLIQDGTSAAGFAAYGTPYGAGTIVGIYETADFFAVGNTVVFDATGARQVMNNNVLYWVVEEDKIYGKENIA